ncbi:MAG: hypothetical protein HYT79_01755 [Elusimicrobia bacterium]|nr:hypothetical protein [Elusimicrobiota bacterium]
MLWTLFLFFGAPLLWVDSPAFAQDAEQGAQVFDGSHRPQGFPVRPDANTYMAVNLDPAHLELQLGIFGLNNGSDHFDPSPFAALEGRWQTSPDTRTHFLFGLRTGYLQLQGRPFPGENARSARLLDGYHEGAASSRDQTDAFAQELVESQDFSRGWNQAQRDAFRSSLNPDSVGAQRLEDALAMTGAPDSSFNAYHLLFASMEAQLARGFHLGGDFDLATAVTAVVDTWTNLDGGTGQPHIYGNGQTDLSFGLRWRPRNPLGAAAALFIGDSQNYSPVGLNPLREALRVREDAQGSYSDLVGFHFDHAPHAGVGVWSGLPFIPDGFFEVQSRVQLNGLTVTDWWPPMTVEQRHVLRVGGRAWDRPFEVTGEYYREEGRDIEFFRQGGMAGLTVSPVGGLAVGVNGFVDSIDYGGAQRTAGGVLFAVGGNLDAGPVSVYGQGAFGVNSRNSRREPVPSSDGLVAARDQVLDELRNDPEDGRIISLFLDSSPGVREGLLRLACSSIMADEEGHQFSGPAGDGSYTYTNPELRDCMSLYRSLPVVDATLGITQDPELLSDLALRITRNRLMNELSGEGRNAGDLLAMGAMMSGRLTPLPPLTASDRDAFKDWLIYNVGIKAMNMNPGTFSALSYQEKLRLVADWIRNNMIPAGMEDILRQGTPEEFVDAFADYLFEAGRTQGNREGLELLMAGEELNSQFGVTRGLAPAEVGRGALLDAFDRMDR